MRLQPVALLILVASLFARGSAAQTPDGRDCNPPIPLGPLVERAQHVVILEVEKADLKGIVFKKQAALKGQDSPVPLTCSIPQTSFQQSFIDYLYQLLVNWARPGQQAVAFSHGDRWMVCFGNAWHGFIKKEGVWEIDEESRPWRSTYVGPVEKLIQHVRAIQTGQDVVITASAWSDHDDLSWLPQRRPGGSEDWLHGRKGKVWRITAGPGIWLPRRLGRGVGRPEVVPELLAALKHADVRVRSEAALDLAELPEPPDDALPRLVQALKDPSGIVRAHSILAVLRIDPRNQLALAAIPGLVTDQDDAVRRAMISVLTELGPLGEPVVADLFAALRREQTAVIRVDLIQALGGAAQHPRGIGCRHPEVVRAVVQALRDPDLFVQNQALRTLHSFGLDARPALPILADLLAREDDDPVLLRTLIRLGPEGVAVLTRQLRDQKPHWRTLTYLQCLGPAARPAFPDLMGLLHTPPREDDRVFAYHQEQIARALLKIDRRLAAPHIAPVLARVANAGDRFSFTGGATLQILFDLQEMGPDAQAAVPWLIEVWNQPDIIGSNWRSPASRALAAIGPAARAAVPHLRIRLTDPSGEIRLLAVEALRKIDDQPDGLVPAVLSVLRDRREDDSSRRTAAALLGELAERHPVPVDELIRDLRRARGQNRGCLVEALGRLGPKARAAVPLLCRLTRDPDPSLRIEAAVALTRIDPANRAIVPALQAVLRDPDPFLRIEAAKALARIDPANPMIVPTLQAVLREPRATVVKADDPLLVARVDAVDALAMLDADVVVRELLPLLIDLIRERPDPRTAAERAEAVRREYIELGTSIALLLQQLGPKARSALPALTTQLRDLDDTRQADWLNALQAIDPDHPELLPALLRVLEGDPEAWRSVQPALARLGGRARPVLPGLLRSAREADVSDYLKIGRLVRQIDAETAQSIWGDLDQPPPPRKLAERELAPLWTDLASLEASRAVHAYWTIRLADSPPIAFFRQQLRPVPHAAPDRVAQLIRGLDSNHFEVRQTATEELEQLESVAESALRQVLEQHPPLEVRQRVEQLLAGLEPGRCGVRQRERHAIDVLRQTGTAEARELLEKLAGGAPEAQLTQEAKKALAGSSSR